MPNAEQCEDVCPSERKGPRLPQPRQWSARLSQDSDLLAFAVSMNQGNEDGDGVSAPTSSCL
ncbi:hypothetical protein M514_08698 [Trichuris suis]|uniref:Uncharacterized protein n=1 Tax=Trichuris suis TaxID=68888 RepID=A0A085LZS5_9BILA|nr:hypothetical protein M513_08698 [Trichuris suis]KFD62357.1 hypothetical protein M514_08698 [Trichuris suis]